MALRVWVRTHSAAPPPLLRLVSPGVDIARCRETTVVHDGVSQRKAMQGGLGLGVGVDADSLATESSSEAPTATAGVDLTCRARQPGEPTGVDDAVHSSCRG